MHYTKYINQFKDVTNQEFELRICDTENVTPVQIKTGEQPVIINQALIGYMHQSIWSTGGELQLISTSNKMFESLYTNDKFKYKVELYKNVYVDGYLTYEPVFYGFLNPELYSEGYNTTHNYEVSYTFNDGFSLLKRIPYKIDKDTKFTGITSMFNVITNVLNKLGLHLDLFVNCSTIASGVTLASSECAFQKEYVFNENYKNEDGDAEKCDKVLESILLSHNCYIIQKNGCWYINDIHSIAVNSSVNFKKYVWTEETNAYNYVSTTSINFNIGDVSSIGYSATNNDKGYINGISKQVVSFSKYCKSTLFDGELKLEDVQKLTPYTGYELTHLDNEIGTTYVGSDKVNTDANFGYKQTYYSGNTGSYVMVNNSNYKATYSYIKGTGTGNDSDSELCVRLPYALDLTAFKLNYKQTKLFDLKLFTDVISYTSKDYYFKVSADLLVRTEPLFNPATKDSHGWLMREVRQVYLPFHFKVGDYYYQYHRDAYYKNNQWLTVDPSNWDNQYMYWHNVTTAKEENYRYKLKQSTCEDVWINSKPKSNIPVTVNGYNGDNDFDLIPIKGLGSGTISICINQAVDIINEQNYSNDMKESSNSGGVHEYFACQDIFLKNLNISITDASGNEVSNSDKEYVGYFDDNFENEGRKIDMIVGTNVDDYPLCLGGVMYNDNGNYKNLQRWVKGSNSGILETLLLNSINSNSTQRKHLRLNLRANNMSSTLGYLTYASQEGADKMIVCGYSYDLANNSISVDVINYLADKYNAEL